MKNPVIRAFLTPCLVVAPLLPTPFVVAPAMAQTATETSRPPLSIANDLRAVQKKLKPTDNFATSANDPRTPLAKELGRSLVGAVAKKNSALSGASFRIWNDIQSESQSWNPRFYLAGALGSENLKTLTLAAFELALQNGDANGEAGADAFYLLEVSAFFRDEVGRKALRQQITDSSKAHPKLRAWALRFDLSDADLPYAKQRASLDALLKMPATWPEMVPAEAIKTFSLALRRGKSGDESLLSNFDREVFAEAAFPSAARYDVGLRLALANGGKDAVAAYQNTLKLPGLTPDQKAQVGIFLGQELEKQKQPPLAVAAWQKAIADADAPGNEGSILRANARFLLAQHFVKTGQYDKASPLLAILLGSKNLPPQERSQVIFWQASEWGNKKQFAKARETLQLLRVIPGFNAADANLLSYQIAALYAFENNAAAVLNELQKLGGQPVMPHEKSEADALLAALVNNKNWEGADGLLKIIGTRKILTPDELVLWNALTAEAKGDLSRAHALLSALLKTNPQNGMLKTKVAELEAKTKTTPATKNSP